MPLSPAPHEKQGGAHKLTFKDFGRRVLRFTGLLIGSAYAVDKQSAGFVIAMSHEQDNPKNSSDEQNY